MKLITEKIEDAKIVITEGKNGKRNTFIEGVFLQAEICNRNGRMYPMRTMEREVLNTTKISLSLVVLWVNWVIPMVLPSTSTVLHLITSLKREGNNFVGKARLLETPMGKIAKSTA